MLVIVQDEEDILSPEYSVLSLNVSNFVSLLLLVDLIVDITEHELILSTLLSKFFFGCCQYISVNYGTGLWKILVST